MFRLKTEMNIARAEVHQIESDKHNNRKEKHQLDTETLTENLNLLNY